MKVKNPFHRRNDSIGREGKLRSFFSKKCSATGVTTDQSSDNDYSSSNDTVGTFCYNTADLPNLPSFDVESILCGSVLGEGAFCIVNSVLNMPGARPLTVNNPSLKTEYALKRLHYDKQFKNMDRAVTAIANEAWLLQRIEHPHIIRLHAVPSDPRWTAWGKGTALVLDRLYMTLDEQKKKWATQRENIAKKCVDSTMAFTKERLKLCLDLSSALIYLHKHKILHRDLKPPNVGFDTNGILKVFDFGIARTLPVDKRHDGNLTYHMTKEVGTRRYMAPEVILGKPYNTGCDVYAFSLILWELYVLAGKPLGEYAGAKQLREAVCVRGERPSLADIHSPNIREVLKFGWHDDLLQRWTMRQIQKALKFECHGTESSSHTHS